MLHKTQGIVLGISKYSDRYSISRIFTRDFGMVSYLLPVSRSKNSKIKNSLFFPFSILNLEVEHKPLRDIQRLKEVERLYPLYEVCSDMTKLYLSFFLSEFLTRVLRESDNNEVIFDFLNNSVETLEESTGVVANFHIAFMIALTRFLGIYPNWDTNFKNSYFDMVNGEFVERRPSHTHFLNLQESSYLAYLSRMNYNNMHLYKLSRNNRNQIVDYLLEYYRLHLYDFPKLKSLDVLREL